MIDYKCEHFRNDDGCRWCGLYNNLQCERCHKDEEDDSLDRLEY